MRGGGDGGGGGCGIERYIAMVRWCVYEVYGVNGDDSVGYNNEWYCEEVNMEWIKHLKYSIFILYFI